MLTDIVNSTRLKGMMQGDTSASRDDRYRIDIKQPHDSVVLRCVDEAGGYVLSSTGDGYFCTFADAEEAVLCALSIQERLVAAPVSTPLGPLQVRIGLHTGVAGARDGEYVASTLDKTARVERQADGGDVLISRETHALIDGKLRGIALSSVGAFDLKGLGAEELFRVSRGRGSAGSSTVSGPAAASDATATLPPAPGVRSPAASAHSCRQWVWGGVALICLASAGAAWRWGWFGGGGADGAEATSRGFGPSGLTGPAALRAGSEWSGSFRFLPPTELHTGDVHLSITTRDGDDFAGVYTTEGGKFEWLI
jgi:class 3 adenylate cyclase